MFHCVAVALLFRLATKLNNSESKTERLPNRKLSISSYNKCSARAEFVMIYLYCTHRMKRVHFYDLTTKHISLCADSRSSSTSRPRGKWIGVIMRGFGYCCCCYRSIHIKFHWLRILYAFAYMILSPCRRKRKTKRVQSGIEKVSAQEMFSSAKDECVLFSWRACLCAIASAIFNKIITNVIAKRWKEKRARNSSKLDRVCAEAHGHGEWSTFIQFTGLSN